MPRHPRRRHLMTGLQVIIFCLPSFVFAASRYHPHANELKQAWPLVMNASRYNGHKDFYSQSTMAWVAGEDRMFHDSNKVMHRILIGFDPCESVLSEQQLFPLHKMVGTGYLPESHISHYLRMGEEQLHTGQVNFTQVSRIMAEDKARALFDLSREGYRINYNIDSMVREGELPIITATMWSVAGQTLDPHTGQVSRRNMPWQLDPTRARLSWTFEQAREDDETFWEVGRAAQDLPREAEVNASALSAILLHELITFRRDPNRAYVMLHSFDKVNTRAYSLRFRNRIFPPGWANEDDTLFLVPLMEFVAAFPPERHSAKYQRLQTLAPRAIEHLQATELVVATRLQALTQLDGLGPLPLTMHDESAFRPHGVYHLLERLFPEDGEARDALADFFVNAKVPELGWNAGQYPDSSDPFPAALFYQPSNAVEISNLNVTQAIADDQYVQKVLIASFMYYIKKIVFEKFGQLSDHELNRAIHGLEDLNVRFGLTTHEPRLMARIRELHPQVEHQFAYAPSPIDLTEHQGLEPTVRGFVSPPHAFLFTVQQILDLIQKDLPLYRQVLNALREDRWAKYMLLSDPDIF